MRNPPPHVFSNWHVLTDEGSALRKSAGMQKYRRNADAGDRSLERKASQGDVDARLRLIISYLRSGKLPRHRVDIAALYGDPASRIVLAETANASFLSPHRDEQITQLHSYLTSQMPEQGDIEFEARRAWYTLNIVIERAEKEPGSDPVEHLVRTMRDHLDFVWECLNDHPIGQMPQDVIATIQSISDDLTVERRDIHRGRVSDFQDRLLYASMEFFSGLVVAVSGYDINTTFSDVFYYASLAYMGLIVRDNGTSHYARSQDELHRRVGERIIPWLLSPVDSYRGNPEKEWDEYPKAGDFVGGLQVHPSVDSTDSISASLYEYTIIPDIREIPMQVMNATPHDLFYAADDHRRVRKLAADIAQNSWVSPLIVVIDSEGPYILEGAHRLGALYTLGIKCFPALVVLAGS